MREFATSDRTANNKSLGFEHVDEIADVYIYTLACAGMWFEDHEDLLDKALEKMGVNKKRLDGVVEENNGDRNR